MPEVRAKSATTEAATGGRSLIVCAALATAAHAPLVAVHFAHLWARPHYQFVFPVLGIAIWLLWHRWPRGEPYLQARHLERWFLASSVVLLTGAVWINSPLLAAISAIVCSGFFILHAAGIRAIPRLLGAWSLFWLAVPPPLGYDATIIAGMQAVTSHMTSMMLDFIGIPHLMTGNVLHLVEKTCFVDEACSGIHSLFALFGYTAVFAVVTSRRLVNSWLLLIGSFGWAVLLNVLRVTTIASASVSWGADLSTGWPHKLLGLATFLLALGLTLSTDQWLHFVGYWTVRLSRRLRSTLRRPRIRRSRSTTTASGWTRPQGAKHQGAWVHSFRPSQVRPYVAMSAYGLLLIANVAMRTDQTISSGMETPLAGIGVQFLPEETGLGRVIDFERIDRGFSSDFGNTSVVWTLDDSSGQAMRVSLDGAFSNWHELTRCYEGQGWTLDTRETVHAGGLSWVEATFSKRSGEHACLAFSLAGYDGRPLTPVTGPGTELLDRLREVPAIQVQAFAECSSPVDELLRERVRRALQVTLSRWCHPLTSPATREQSGEETQHG